MTTAIETPSSTTAAASGTEIGSKIAFDSITMPGAYVCNATGHLLRIGEDWNAKAMNAWWSWAGDEPLWFTCISTDPAWSVEDCRTSAGELGLNWSF